MKAGTVGTKGDVSKATSGRSDGGDKESWNGEMGKLRRKLLVEGVMMETRKTETEETKKGSVS